MSTPGGGREARVKSVFGEAASLHREARHVLLLGLRDTDPEIADEVESLLEHHDRTDAILDRTPADAALLAPRETDDEDLALPAALGAYTLLRVLGEGGMGVVYEAEQASPRRRVAVKLVRPEIASASVLRRFEHEVEALGLLDHPGIARVYEAGRASLGGRPRAFIAMELVEGSPLTDHARGRALPVSERLELCAQLCDAIQFAHRRGVIHRDLKPGNILVGADGRARVLDFGVARLAEAPDRAAASMMTRAGQIVGTLAYMSPEQARGDAAEIDSRTDIYSLGAVLFELLCGRPPVDVSGVSLHAALARIQTEEPRVPREVRAGHGRDLEAILLKALEKDPARRYQHASELAADLRSYLKNEPVSARAPTRTYQFAKFCRRNRELVAAAALVMVTAVVAFGAIGVALSRERVARAAAVAAADDAGKARDEAVASAEKSTRTMARYEAVNSFLQTLLGGVRPEVARGKDTALLRTILENSERSLPDLAHQPAAMADALVLLADVYRSLGDFERSEGHYRRAIELYTESLGERRVDTATAMHNLGALYRGSLRRYDEAAILIRRSRDIYRELFGEDDQRTRSVNNSLALLYMDTAQYALAEPILRDLREYEERANGPDAKGTLRAMHNHAGALSMTGRIHEALALAKETMDRRARTFGENHTDTASSMLFYANTLRACGRAEESLPVIRRVIEIRSSQMGPSHQLTLSARGSLANSLAELGRTEEALAEAGVTAALSSSTLGPDHIDTIQLRLMVVEFGALLGRCEGLVDEARAIRGVLDGMGERYAFWSSFAGRGLGLALACAGDAAAAEASLRTAYAELDARVGGANSFTRRTAESLAWFCRKEGREAEAREWDSRAAAPKP